MKHNFRTISTQVQQAYNDSIPSKTANLLQQADHEFRKSHPFHPKINIQTN